MKHSKVKVLGDTQVRKKVEKILTDLIMLREPDPVDEIMKLIEVKEECNCSCRACMDCISTYP